MSDGLRAPVDPVGFATRAEQMREVARRIDDVRGRLDADVPAGPSWRVAIVPHDDYTYVGGLYPAVLDGVRARTVILIGVAHKARTLGLEDQLLFESFSAWSAPYGPVALSSMREAIIAALPSDSYRVHDEMHALEHSLEAIVPFLQHRRHDLEIVPILAPAMSFDRMRDVAAALGAAIAGVMRERSQRWGADVAIVISSDAVHYGDEEWGGRDFARFGVDDEGYRRAVAYEHAIIEECLLRELSIEKLRALTAHLVSAEDFREYRWTWCGRYSVPCGLLTGLALAGELGVPPPAGVLVGYGTSVDGRPHVRVDDLGMGVTAPATLRHWVGYASVGYT
jgi:MEMO1 family protein